jgi:hypothetical protein
MDGEAVVLGIDGISDLNASTMKRSSSAPSIAMDGDDLRRLSAPAAASSLCVARGWERSEELKRLGSFRKNVTGSHRLCFRGFRRRAGSATVLVDELDLAIVKLGAASSRRRGSGPFPYVSPLKKYPHASAVGVDEFDSSSLQRPLNCFDGPFL